MLPETPDLDPIDLWLTFYDEIDEQWLAQLEQPLSQEERQRERRFHFADDRKRFRVTRWLVRTVLSRYAPIAPRDWQFTANRHGRPEIANGDDAAGELSFNLSHTRGLIALGVSRRRALGVDVENCRTRQAPLGVADRFFSPPEAAELAGLPAEGQTQRFFEYWVLKESYIKARGMGLAIPLNRFGFAFPREGAVELTVEPDLGDDPQRWRLWLCRPAADYLLAICAEGTGIRMPPVTFRRILPGDGETVLQSPILKTSRPLEP